MSLYPLDDRDPDGRGMPGDMRYDYERTRWRLDIEQRGRERRAQQRALLDFLVWGWGGAWSLRRRRRLRPHGHR